MNMGIVKWFNNEKGYGFIEYKDNEDIFVHYTAIQCDKYKTLKEGQAVEFELVITDKGLQAKNVSEILNFVLDGKIVKVNLLGKIKEKYILDEDNYKILTLIITILSMIISLIMENNVTENDVNINCDNCEINIYESDKSNLKIVKK